MKEMGSLLRAHGIPGSDSIFKTQMLEMLAWHEMSLVTPFLTVLDDSDTFTQVLGPGDSP